MPSTAQFLEGLRNKRLKWIEANRENDFEQGIINLLTELYPEQAHFIFELFQNAEDALASSINFKLSSDRLIVTHNGKRQFDENDVKSITSICQSTKKDDLNQIGKFGVGFKAVFSYTATPIVHSGDFNFEINDLVCPHAVAKPVLKNGNTQFVFPFNNPNKNSQKCFEEVAKGLAALQDNVLLFLNNIDEICWDIEGRGKGRLTRITRDNDVIEIQSDCSGKSTNGSSYWLRFQKSISEKSNLFVGVAFRLAFQDANHSLFENSTKLSEFMKIVPLDDGQLSIYFPAEKEVTKLKFHIHGPYASTVARDSIKCDHDGNLELLELTSDLIRESLHQIKGYGLLTTEFLAVLPNNKDMLDDFYEPILTSITEEFKEHKLLPGRYVKYVDAVSAKNGPADIKNSLYDSDLAFFCNNADVKWVAAAKQKNSRADNFLDSLDIDEWGWNELNTAMRSKFGSAIQPSTASWIADKTDEWIQRFYAMLDTLLQERRYYTTGKESWRIVRTYNNKHVKGFEAFFPDENFSIDAQFPRVKAEIFKGTSKRQIEKAINLLRELGVSDVGEKQEIEGILRKCYSADSNGLSEKQHLQHVQQFTEWWKENRDIDLFDGFYLFRDQEGTFNTPNDLYIDQPYKDTGLKLFFSALKDDTAEIWDGYSKIKGIYDFATAIGVKDKIEIAKVSIYGNPDYTSKLYASGKRTAYETKDDYSINKIEVYLRKSNKDISLLIWRTVANAPKNVLKARYCPNKETPYRYADSQLVHQLKNNAWIPATDGKFYRPPSVSQDMLLPEFKNFFLNANGWLDAIGFGEHVKKRTEEYLKHKEYAERLGIPLEIAEQLNKIPAEKRLEFYKKLQSEMDSFLNPPLLEPLPSSPAPNPDRRQQKALEEAQDAAEKESEKKMRSVRISKLPEIKSYLRAQHTNENNNVICQICNGQMPFKIGAEDYFEAVQFLKSAAKEYLQNHLALCPNCAAEYKHACATSEQERIGLLLNLDSSQLEDELKIPLNMPLNGSLRFTQKHLIDIQAAMQDHEQLYESSDTANLEDAEEEEQEDILPASSEVMGAKSRSVNVNSSASIATSAQTSIHRSNSALQTPANNSQISAISDRRVVRAISGMKQISIYDKADAVSKVADIIRTLVNYGEFSQHMNQEGIHITTLKMAVDHLVPGLDIQQFGFSKYPQFIDYVCKASGCAFLHFKKPADFRISKRAAPFPGYIKFDCNYVPPTVTNSSNHQTAQKTVQNNANVRTYIPPPPPPKPSANHCKFCGSRAMAGSDVCYSCG